MASFVVDKHNHNVHIRPVSSVEEVTYDRQHSEMNFILYMAACQGKVDFVLTLLNLGAEFPAVRVKDIALLEMEKQSVQAVIFDASKTHQTLTGTPQDRRPIVLEMVKGLGAIPKTPERRQALRRIVLMHHYLPVLYAAYVHE